MVGSGKVDCDRIHKTIQYVVLHTAKMIVMMMRVTIFNTRGVRKEAPNYQQHAHLGLEI